MPLSLSAPGTPVSAPALLPGAAGAPDRAASPVREERDWSRAADRSAERLGFATLGYVVAATLVITLAPFRFSLRPVHGLFNQWTWDDLVMNVVMFVPLGFLFQVTRPRGSRGGWYNAILLGALLSTGIETAQLFEASRYSSVFDVLTNTAGAATGALAFTLLSRRLRVGASTVSTLALELPLMGLVYLLVPLLWLVGLSSGTSERAWLMLPLAGFGGAILGAVHGAYLQPAQRLGTVGLLLGSATWWTVAAVPGGRHQPVVLAVGAVVAMGAAWLRSVATTRARLRHGPRRFELPTLRLVMPLFAAYLGLSSLWPLTAASGVWQGGWALFPAVSGELSQRLVFQALEFSAAFTLVGYLIAEFHGRVDDVYRATVGRVLRWGGALAVMLELARGWHAELGSSVVMAALAITASVFGGWLYHLQRDHVRALWTRDRGTPAV